LPVVEAVEQVCRRDGAIQFREAARGQATEHRAERRFHQPAEFTRPLGETVPKQPG